VGDSSRSCPGVRCRTSPLLSIESSRAGSINQENRQGVVDETKLKRLCLATSKNSYLALSGMKSQPQSRDYNRKKNIHYVTFYVPCHLDQASVTQLLCCWLSQHVDKEDLTWRKSLLLRVPMKCSSLLQRGASLYRQSSGANPEVWRAIEAILPGWYPDQAARHYWY